MNPFTKIRLFYGETIGELKKASWPSRNDLRESTIVVFFTILFLAVFIALCDFSVYNWVALLTKALRPGA